jgi:hypothetical protein
MPPTISYTGSMSPLAMFRRQRVLLGPLLLVAILFAQGLRLCLHAPPDAAADHVHTTALHIESDLIVGDDMDNAPGDRHVPMDVAFVKKIADACLWAALFAASVLFLLPRVVNRPLAVPVSVLPYAGTTWWRPPLRAPPH